MELFYILYWVVILFSAVYFYFLQKNRLFATWRHTLKEISLWSKICDNWTIFLRIKALGDLGLYNSFQTIYKKKTINSLYIKIYSWICNQLQTRQTLFCFTNHVYFVYGASNIEFIASDSLKTPPKRTWELRMKQRKNIFSFHRHSRIEAAAL